MKIKYLLLSLLTPLLVSFCSASFFDNTQFTSVWSWFIEYVNNDWIISENNSRTFNFSDNWVYCVVFYLEWTGFDFNYNTVTQISQASFVWSSERTSTTSDTIRVYKWDFYKHNYLIHCNSSFVDNRNNLKWSFKYNTSNSSNQANYDTAVFNLLNQRNWNRFVYEVWYVPFSWFNILPNIWGWSSDCSSVESQLTSCQSSLNTMSWSLASCQSSLSDCQWNWSHCDTLYGQCVENLSWCNADKVSLQNYNDSLSSQLNSCLASLTSWENASWLYLTYNMFWQDSDSMFSLPITNNLFLPNGYKWKLDDDNVLSIAKLNNLEAAYMFSDDDKVNIIDLLSMVMLFLLATWSLIWLIVFLKRLVIKK